MILIHPQMFRPVLLVRQLLDTTAIYNNMPHQTKTSICLQQLPTIINEISKYCQKHRIDESALMIDIQQWIHSSFEIIPTHPTVGDHHPIQISEQLP